MTRAFVTGISGQDGSYLAERLLAEGVEVHALAHGDEPSCPDCPGVELHVGDLTRVDEVRSLVLDLAPDEIYNLAAVSSVARSWAEPDLTARVNGMAAVVADGVRAPAAGEARAEPSAWCRPPAPRSSASRASPPRTRTPPIRPVNPYGAAKAYAHLMVDVYRHRDLHAVSAILYNHESPRRPAQFVTRKITSTVAAIAQGRAERLTLGQPGRPAGLGLGARLRRRDGARGARPRRPVTT